MKINTLHIIENKMFKDIKFQFSDLTVIAGANGTGKTTILESIFYGLQNFIYSKEEKIKFDFKFEEKEEKVLNSYSNLKNFLEDLENVKIKDMILPKIIYVPAEIKFDDIDVASTTLKNEYKFFNIVDNNLIQDIPSYIASKIIYTANIEENLTMGEVRKKVINEINSIFSILDIDVQLKGISKDEKSIPIFTNSSKDEFDINSLSSGEKQLFLRALSLYMLNPINSIILIDEPELSLHPKWQQKIVEIYRKIGKNNQIIIATHSPHIVGSVDNKNVLILSKNELGNITINLLNLNDKRLQDMRKKFTLEAMYTLEYLDDYEEFPSLKKYLKENFKK